MEYVRRLHLVTSGTTILRNGTC